jgi:hypothetical protein
MLDVPRGRRGLALELGICTVVVAALSLYALGRMDYLGAETMQHIRATDASRTAYVAKNLVEGRGYVANDLPAALIDFYDQRGKLHLEHWPNADRFPFAAYATAALYLLTGNTSWVVGILIYNLVFFVAFLVLLYALAGSVFRDRYAGLFAVAVALLHPYTYMYLYWKDSDSVFLSTLTVLLLLRYFRTPRGELGRAFAVGLGTVLAFVFLSRPNQGAPMLLAVGISILARVWSERRARGLGPALRQLGSRELLIPITTLVWCLPFMVHSYAEWGSPLFSANNLYQLPLGTRYGMGTDTWWKYTEPGQFPSFDLLADRAGDELRSKLVSSWIATVRHLVEAHALELVLVVGLVLAWRRRPPALDTLPLRRVAIVFGIAVVANLLALPLYAYQSYSFRHYLAFAFPLVWSFAGGALCALATGLAPVAEGVAAHVRAHARAYLLGAVAVLVAWNLGAPSQLDRHRVLARTSELFGDHWVAVSLAIVAVLARRWIVRPPWLPRVALLATALVVAYFRPYKVVKPWHFVFAASHPEVWPALAAGTGVVSSFAMQGEVAWNTGRRNIPAPELPMHLYSFLFDHGVEIGDLYIESAESLVAGPFAGAAPGFEGYARLQRERALPGYQVVFHREALQGYPRFRIAPQLRASTVFRLVDREAVRRMRRSPDRIALGEPTSAIYTPHGWEQRAVIDGKPVLAATHITQARYAPRAPRPWEDASITFFIDERHPREVELEFYSPHRTQLRFYWNLDLYAYDRPGDRARHEIGTHTVEAPGWQRVRLTVPAGLLKRGLNKLGLRRSEWGPTVLCPAGTPSEVCLAGFADRGPKDEELAGLQPHAVAVEGLTEAAYPVVALLAHELVFRY